MSQANKSKSYPIVLKFGTVVAFIYQRNFSTKKVDIVNVKKKMQQIVLIFLFLLQFQFFKDHFHLEFHYEISWTKLQNF